MLTQSVWRRYAAFTLAGAAAMALYAAVSGILRGTVYLLVSLFSEADVERAQIGSGWVYLAYWALFALLLLATLYISVLDLRFIRLRYVAQRRELFSHTLGTGEIGESVKDPPEDSS